jgi:hypothetical protein
VESSREQFEGILKYIKNEMTIGIDKTIPKIKISCLTKIRRGLPSLFEQLTAILKSLQYGRSEQERQTVYSYISYKFRNTDDPK